MVKCDYCGKPSKDTRRMICGPNGSAICDECVHVCVEILFKEFNGQCDIPFTSEKEDSPPIDPPCQTC